MKNMAVKIAGLGLIAVALAEAQPYCSIEVQLNRPLTDDEYLYVESAAVP